MGGGGNHGWIHVSDERNPPDFGRVAWPEDIFGSLEVDGNGNFVGENGNYQSSGVFLCQLRSGEKMILIELQARIELSHGTECMYSISMVTAE